MICFQIFFYTQILSHGAQRVVCNSEFAQVILPCVGARAAPGIGLAGDGGDGAVGLAPGKGLVGNLEGDLFARLPEVGGKLMREEERVVAALAVQSLDGIGSVQPGQAEATGVPLTEVEAVGSGLRYEEMKQFKSSHEWIGLCSADGVFSALKIGLISMLKI